MDATTTIGLSLNDRLNERCQYWSFQACQDSGHPNVRGYQSLAKCLTAAWVLEVDSVDCDRIGSAMLANNQPIDGSLGGVQITISTGPPSESIDMAGDYCIGVDFAVPIVVDAGQWTPPTITGNLGVTSLSGETFTVSDMTLRGRAPCAPAQTYMVTGSLAITLSTGETVTENVATSFTLQGDPSGGW